MDQMSQRMKGRFTSGAQKQGSHNRILNIIQGKDVATKKPVGKRKKASGSVNIYLEFASCYAQICYAYAQPRGGVKALNTNPLYLMSVETATKAVREIGARAKKLQRIDRPQVVPTAILALGLLDQKALWQANLAPFIIGEESPGKPFWEDWVSGTDMHPGWDVHELTNVLWGAVTMGLHKTAECRRLVQACLQRVSTEEMLVTCTAATLTRLLTVATQLKETTGPIATAVSALFENAARRITELAQPNATPKELKALPGEVEMPAAGHAEHMGGERIMYEDYDNDNYLIGSFSLGQLIEVLEAYNATGRTRSMVHTAVAGRVLATQDLRETINKHPAAAVELIYLFLVAYSNPLYQVLCQPLQDPASWKKLKIGDVHRVLRAVHHTKFPGREGVFQAVEQHLINLLILGKSSLLPSELSSLRSLLTSVGIENDDLYTLIADLALRE
eukprot:TRINITY_DN23608_c0_g1_i2.p1 TRINITY_DN23608_c0_g1~~TRINITY_DN23608_c0_g1_i2.p1  ORF type:complete len:518 (+),score=212.40 TRINITY_DN23608_c0_g1_i2:215-1555(+)